MNAAVADLNKIDMAGDDLLFSSFTSQESRSLPRHLRGVFSLITMYRIFWAIVKEVRLEERDSRNFGFGGYWSAKQQIIRLKIILRRRNQNYAPDLMGEMSRILGIWGEKKESGKRRDYPSISLLG